MSEPAPTPAPAPAENKISAKSAGIVSAAVMCSRVLGVVREQLIAYFFGAKHATDTFQVAFRTPNLMRDLFAEGALSTAFITNFTKKIATEGEASAWQLANKVGTLVLVFLSTLVVIGILLAPWLVKIMAPGFSNVPGKSEQTAFLAQIMYPFLLLVSLGALSMGVLNARNVFGPPAMASSFFNIGSIVGGLSLAWWFDPHFGPRSLIGLAIGTLIGGALQLLVQVPALRRVGYHFRLDFDWKDEGVRDVLRAMGPAVIAASSVQVNVFINTMFASSLAEGTVTCLGIAFRFMQFPLGMVGVALGTVTLPVLSRAAAAKNMDQFRSVLAKGMRLAFLLTVPASVGLFVLARPIISVLYEHGEFDARATDQAALGLQGYALGLAAYSALKILSPAFYAIEKRTLPMVVSFISIFLNAGLNWLLAFHYHMGIAGLAMATGVVATVNFTLLYGLMRREIGSLDSRALFSALVKVCISSALMGGLCWWAQKQFLIGWSAWSFLHQAAMLAVIVAAGAVVFFGTALALRVGELDEVTALAKRKLGRFIK